MKLSRTNVTDTGEPTVVNKQKPEQKETTANPKPRTDIQRFLIQERLRNNSRSYQHPSYLLEQQLCEAIKKGSLEDSFRTLDHINTIERAELSSDPMRSLKNSLIGSCTIFARAAISGGVDSESAFMLSDLYIRLIEKLSSRQAAESLEYDMLQAFVEAVTETRKSEEETQYSPLVARARQYIRQHVQRHLTLADIAEHVNVHPNYLSNVFSKECQQPLMTFYDSERIQSICEFLRFTDISLSDVAVNFEFASFSHFSSYFKKQTGFTPREYRKQSQMENER